MMLSLFVLSLNLLARRGLILAGVFSLGLLPVYAGNLLTNGDFSTTDANGLPTSWTAENASLLSIDTTQFPAGQTRSLRVATQDEGTSSLGSIGQSLNVAASGAPLSPDSHYVARVWTKGTVGDLARLEVKRFNGSTEIDRTDSIGSTSDWSKVAVSIDTTGVTRVEVLLRYKKNSTAAGQTAWFAGTELITAAEAGADARLGTVALVPTFESVSAYIGFTGTFTTQTLRLDYRTLGESAWHAGLPPPFYPADNEFRGSLLLLQPDTNYEVRAQLWLDATLLDEQTTSVTTWAENVPIASEVTVPATSTGTYVITAQGSPTGWIRYRAASGGSTIDVTGTTGATEAVVLDHAAYVIVEGLTIRGGTQNGVRIDNSHDIRVRDCEVTDWSAPGTFTFVNQGDLDYGYVDANGVSINLRAGIRIVGPGSTRVVLERNLIHRPVGKSPSWAFGHPNGPEGIVLDTTGGNNVVRYNDILAADGHFFNDAIESVQNGNVTGGPYRDSDIYGNLLQGANDDGTELDGGQMNVRYWHNWVEGGSASVSTAPNLKGSSYIFRNVLVTGDERGGAQAGSIKMGGAPGVTFLLQNTIIAPGYGLTSGHYAKAGAVSPVISRNNLFTGLLPGDGRVRLDDAVSGDLDYDLIPPTGVLPITFVPGPGREANAVFDFPSFVAPEQRDFLLASGSAGIAAGAPLANLTPDNVTAPDIGAVDTTNQNASWPIRPLSPETAPNRIVIRVRQGQAASAPLEMLAPTTIGATWTARGGDAWLTVSPTSGNTGSASQTLQCAVDGVGLSVGEHRTFVSIRTSTGALRTVPVVVQVEPSQTLSFSREAEGSTTVGGFVLGSDANASGGEYLEAVALQPGQTNGEIGLDFTVPEDGTYYILARVRAAGPANRIPTQDSIVLRIDGGEDLRWDLWGVGEDVWSWNRAYVVPASPTSDVIGRFTLTAGAHHVALVARELGAQIDQFVVSNDPFIPALPPGPVPQIFTATLPNAGEGVAYTQTLLGAGEAPLAWSVVTGSLPAGLALSTDGVIAGTPTALGNSVFTVQLRDADGDTVTRQLSLTVTLPPVATPVFSPDAGTYSSAQSVTISTTTSGAAIRYTIDGSDPSETAGTLYSGPVEIGATTTLRAIAFRSGYTNSEVASAAYVIDLPQVAAPEFSPAPGTYNSAQSVAITSATTGATIRYTLDGTAPTSTSGLIYSAPVAVSSTATLQAIAYASGQLDSAVTNGTYAIGGTPAFQLSGGQVVMEAEHFASETAGAGQDWVAITQAGASGAVTNNALQGLPNLGVGYPALDASLPHVDYLIDVPANAAGNYYVHLRDFGATSTDDSAYVSIDGATAVSQVVSAGRTLDWKTSGGTLALPAGRHTLTLWMREDGIVVDKIVVSTSSMLPTGSGPAESGFAAPPSVDAPTFDPVGGTFDAPQSVTISTATIGATIRYTLDGTMPSATAGIVYNGPVSIEETATLRAIAYLTDGTASSVTSDTYTIELPNGGGAFQMTDGRVVMEAENFTSQTANGTQNWVPVTYTGASGAVSNNALQALPNAGVGYPALDPSAAHVDYAIDVPAEAAGDYYVHVRDVGATSSDDSIYVSIDGSATVSQVVTAGRTLDWKTSASRLSIPAGAHTLTVWMREDGIVIDKIVVDTTSAVPSGFGPPESERAPLQLAPAITSQPVGETATAGDGATLTVAATGEPAPAYQWFKDGSALAGATGPTLVFSRLTTADAGSYTVVVTNAAGSATSDLAQLIVNKAQATVTLNGLNQTYDGAAKPIVVATEPASLPVTVTYNGAATAPTIPGVYTVEATIDDPNYEGNSSGTLKIATGVAVRHAPVINGTLDGSIQVLAGESFSLNSTAVVTGDVLVSGAPTVRLNGTPAYGGTLDEGGATAPATYQVTINDGATARHILRRIDPLPLDAIASLPSPSGSVDVTLNRNGSTAVDFTALRSLTLNTEVGAVAIPPGTYGSFTANSGSGFVLGVAGATEPAVYTLQALTLNSGSRLEIVGPVILNVAGSVAVNDGQVGAQDHVNGFLLRVASYGLTLNGNSTFYGEVTAPAGTVVLSTNSRLTGRVAADRLTINSGGVLTVTPQE